jgi:lysophospholipase L1-like esterase
MLRKIAFCLSLSLVWLNLPALFAQEKNASDIAPTVSLLNPSDRIIFLGDSNTYAAGYIDLLDAYFRLHQPQLKLELLNLGLPSETACGLSEPDHPYPRPDVHERIDRVLEKTKPNVVFICYGMNDGIYHPFSDERFQAYQAGILDIVKRAQGCGARVLMTPPPFDPLPMKKTGKLRSADADQFAYFAIFEGYDDVLQKYADWIMKQGDAVDLVIDLHTPFNQVLAEKRKTKPDYTMSGDGVHFNQDGHTILATEILNQLGYSPQLKFVPAYFKLVAERQHLLRDAWVTHCGHQRPDTPQGKPLDEATSLAADLETKIADFISAIPEQ